MIGKEIKTNMLPSNKKIETLKKEYEADDVIFLRREFNTETDGLKGINKYRIYDVYDVVYHDERGSFAKTELKYIDEFDLTWKEIDEMGGLSTLLEEIQEAYRDYEIY